VLLEMLGEGRLHLSAIAKLAPYLTEANRDTLLARAAGKSKRQIEELVAELSPKPDVPATIRKLPERRERRLTRLSLAPPPNDARNRAANTRPDLAQLGPDRVGPSAAPASLQPVQPAVLEPLAPARYRVQFTASGELHCKLERLRALMKSSVPDGDLAAIIEAAVTEKLERLEAKRFAKTCAPRKSLEQTDTSPSSRHIPAAVKRAVWDRNGNQCTFVDNNGRRCAKRNQLEFHHREPFGRGGDHSPENIQLVCRTHNAYFAEREYGKEVMERYRRAGPTRVESAPPSA